MILLLFNLAFQSRNGRLGFCHFICSSACLFLRILYIQFAGFCCQLCLLVFCFQVFQIKTNDAFSSVYTVSCFCGHGLNGSVDRSVERFLLFAFHISCSIHFLCDVSRPHGYDLYRRCGILPFTVHTADKCNQADSQYNYPYGNQHNHVFTLRYSLFHVLPPYCQMQGL